MEKERLKKYLIRFYLFLVDFKLTGFGWFGKVGISDDANIYTRKKVKDAEEETTNA